jgi:hypothetical protein
MTVYNTRECIPLGPQTSASKKSMLSRKIIVCFVIGNLMGHLFSSHYQSIAFVVRVATNKAFAVPNTNFTQINNIHAGATYGPIKTGSSIVELNAGAERMKMVCFDEDIRRIISYT